MKEQQTDPDMPPSVLEFIQCVLIIGAFVMMGVFYGEFRKLKTEVYWYKHDVDNVSEKNYGCIEAWDALRKRVDALEGKAGNGQ